MKKIISLLTALFLLGSIGTALAAEDTFKISTKKDLMEFAALVNGGEFEGNAELLEDIELNYRVVDFEGTLNEEEFDVWTPIGTQKVPFSGSFNGNGHTVTGLYIVGEVNFSGLFGCISEAEVYNVTVRDSYISAGDHAGAIAGYAINNSIISNCHNDNSTIYTKNRSGGIVGWTDKSDVYNCSCSGYCYSDRCSGGIVGDVYSNGKIYNCFNSGVVEGKSLVGGMTGGSTHADIRNCINVGEINSKDGYLISGGGGSRTLTNCYALTNETINPNVSIGSGSATTRTFSSAAAKFDKPVECAGGTYETALDALNAWVQADESDIYYSAWKQKGLYPYLADGVISAVRTSYGSETSDWSNENLEEAFEENLVPDVLVSEDLTQKITREEFAAVAVQLYEELSGKKAAAGKNPFSDISGSRCYDAVVKASALGITAGTAPDTFSPKTLITREQLATMLCRAIKKYSFADWTLETDADYYLDTAGVKKFADDADISDYAKPSVYFMAKFGIVNGVSDTHFAPKNVTDEEEKEGYASATREQALVMSLRIFKISDTIFN